MNYVKSRVYRKTIVLLCIITLSVLAGVPALANASGTYSSWHYIRTVTIDHTKVQSNLANFPVLVTLTDASLAAHAQSNGYDILFTLQDGTKLSHEIESYDSATGRLVAWVNIPSVSSAVDTTIDMYYGNPSAGNQQSTNAVWNSNYKAVWHLPDGTTLSAKDSTSNGKNGVITGVTATTGKVDGAGNFAASSNNYVGVADAGNLFNVQNIAVSAWIKPAGTQAQWTDVVDKYHDGTKGWVLEYTSDGQYLIFFMSDGTTMISAQSTTALNDNNWHFVVGTCDGSTVKLYVDGVAQGSSPYSGSAAYYPSSDVAIGRWEKTPSRYFNGAIDEVRISSTASSEDWIKTEYNNQNSPATFAVVSSEIVNPGVSVLPESPVGSLAVVLTIAVGCGVFVKYKSSIRFKA